MAYVPLTTNEIATGEPVSNATQTKIKENFDNLEGRVTSLEGGGAVTYPPIIFKVNGRYDLTIAPVTLITTCNFDLTVTGVFLNCELAGTAGSTEIDIEYKRGGGSWTSIFTTKPSLSYTTGDLARSSNAVLDPTQVELQSGDLIRARLTSSQTDGRDFFIRLDYNKT